MAWSSPKCEAEISCAGDSRAEEGAVAETWYLGVKGSVDCDWFMHSRSKVGNVWLRGRWKLELASVGPSCLPGPFARNSPTFASGEKVNGVVGLNALPGKDGGPASVKALDRDVVLCEFECL
jgi:hypothetical protein